MKQTLYKRKNILTQLLSQPTYQDILFHINTQLKSNTLLQKVPLYKLNNFIWIIWNLSIFRRELQLEVGQMHSNYWMVITWRRGWGVTWYVGWGLLILVTILLSLRVFLAPCERDEIFLICPVITRSKYRVTL